MRGRVRSTRRGGILVVTDRRFWRRSIGSEQRIATLVEHLARHRDDVAVAYVGRISRRERPRLAEFLRPHPKLAVIARPTNAKAIVQGFWRALGPNRPRTGLTRDGVAEEAEPSSPVRRAFVQCLILERRPRVVIIEFLRLSYTLFPLPQTSHPAPHTLIDTHDILHLRAARARARGADVDQPIDAAREWQMLAHYDAVLAIQGLEATRLREGLPGRTVLVVPHGVAVAGSPSRPIAATRPVRIGFLGGRDASNRDALDWFVREVWPGLHAEWKAQVELHVAGQVTKSWSTTAEGVRNLGPVDSIDDFWRAIDIAINPVRYGSGLKIKNVEALAHGRALLTTSIGAEGLEAAGPDGLHIADSASEWTRVLIEWLAHPDLAVEVARRGREFAETHLCEGAAFAELDAHLDGILNGALDGLVDEDPDAQPGRPRQKCPAQPGDPTPSACPDRGAS